MAGTPVAVWAFVGLLAVGSSVGALLNLDLGTRVIMAVFSMVTWMVWALQSTQLDVWSHGTRYSYDMNALLYVGGAAAVIMLLFAVKGTFALVNPDADGAANPADEYQQDMQGGR